jgi:hypothetical protein
VPAQLGRHPPYRRALVIVLVAFAMGSLFVFSYVDALGRPAARRISTGVVGTSPQRVAFTTAIEQATSSGFVLRSYPDRAAAESAADRQDVYAVLVFDARRPATVTVLLSTASGPSVARLLTTALPAAAARTNVRLTVTDLHPLPSDDPSGLAVFYLTLGATIVGFVATFQLRANARPLPLPPWLAFTGGLAVLGSLVLLVVVRYGLHALDVPLLEAWGVLTLQMVTASCVAATMSVLVGRWAIVPTWLLFVVLGNTSSGGPVAPALLPQPFSFLSRALPTGSTVSFLRSAAYFPKASRLEPLLVLAGWAVVAFGALLIVARLKGRGPGDPDPKPA